MMTKWEYLQLDIDYGSNPIDWRRLGLQGWELVYIYRGMAYFKRPIDKGLSTEEFEKKIEQRLERSFLQR